MIQQDMELNGPFGARKLSPREKGQTKRYGGTIQGKSLFLNRNLCFPGTAGSKIENYWPGREFCRSLFPDSIPKNHLGYECEIYWKTKTDMQ